MRRLAIFTHDTFGLGHVRRCLHIVRGFCKRQPESAVLLITGSPAAQAMRDLPPNADFVKLPTIVKTGSAESSPPHLPISVREVTSIRKRMLRSTLESFKPDLLLVDNFPLGSRKELLPALERSRETGMLTVLGLRDIVDRPDVVRATWTKDDVYDTLQRLYDRVLVYGEPAILDAGEAYGMPSDVREKVRYCGYVTPKPQVRNANEVRAELGLDGPLVVATVGGGGDGYPLLSSFVRAMRNLPAVSAVAITGPLMGQRERERIDELAAANPRLVVKNFVPDLPSYVATADAVVAMGGYNTVAELLALERRALVLPRNWRYGEFAKGPDAGLEWEQLMRAEALERMGLVRVLTQDSFEPVTLARTIARALDEPGPVRIPDMRVGGVERVVDELVALIETEKSRVQA